MTIAAVVCDLKWWRIPNRLIVVGLICGVLCNITEFGILGGIKQFALGAVTPIAWLVILFLIRGMGAGDIKLLTVIGGLMGRGIAEIVIYSIFAGSVIGLFGYLVKKIRRIHFSLAVMAGMMIYCFGIVGSDAAV
nr:A24 family peptidase [Coprococcus sp. OM04-5BH]